MARHTNKRRGKSRRRQTRQRSQRGGGIFWDSTAEKIEKNNLEIKALQEKNKQLQQENSTENKNGSEDSWTASITPAFLKPNPNPTPVPTPFNPNNPPVTPVNPNPTIRGGRRRRRRSQRK